MEEKIKELYYQEIQSGGLDFDSDPEYQQYLSQSEALWNGEDMPKPYFDLLDHANFLSFAHGVQFGMRLAAWGLRETSAPAVYGPAPL